MLISRDIKVLHLEPTDVCQAACPLCARETDSTFQKDLQHHLTLQQIIAQLAPDMIAGLHKMFMCGVYGDPAAGKHTMEIYRYFRLHNPSIVLGMNTNGALQTRSWWRDLAQLFDQSHDYCVFSIDGLEDTNHLYRRNVNWHRLMANVQEFIQAGGSAHWDMLVYGHNQHQVDACQQLARDMGFTWFRAKVSRRGFTANLQFPAGWINPKFDTGTIQCQALEEKSMYIDAQGRASACCWLGGRQKDFVTDDLDTVRLSWHSDRPHPVCAATCRAQQDLTSFTSQWQREVQLV